VSSNDPNLRNILPLEKKIADFAGIRTNIFREIMYRRTNLAGQSHNKVAYTIREKPINVDGIHGVIDLAYRSDDYVKIIDFKFGEAFDENREIKNEYKLQLYIYAAMYYKNFNIVPSSLSIIDKDFKEHRIVQKPIDECLAHFEDLKALNLEISNISSINEAARHANPSEENCRFCSVKIDCVSYWETNYPNGENFLDIKGNIIKVSPTYKNYCIDMKSLSYKHIIRVFNIPKIITEGLATDIKYCFIGLSRVENESIDRYRFNKYSKLVKIE